MGGRRKHQNLDAEIQLTQPQFQALGPRILALCPYHVEVNVGVIGSSLHCEEQEGIPNALTPE